jgi:hypothetical protein
MSDIRLSSEGPRGPRGHRGPAGPTGPTGPTGHPPIIASALVISNGGILISTGIVGVTHPSTGLYQIELMNPPVFLANVAVIATAFCPALGVAGNVNVNAETLPNLIEMATFDAAGALSDRSFSVVFYDLTP